MTKPVNPFQKLIDGCFSLIRKGKKTPTTLHHYTTGTTFIDIIESRQLWLTHHGCVNDSTEVSHGINFLYEHLRERIRINADNEYRLLYSSLSAQLANQYSIPPIYIACFSKAPDDLSQWRSYSAPTGYNLGFSSEVMEKNAAKLGFRIAPVVYSQSKKKELVKRMVKALEQKFLSAMKRTDIEHISFTSQLVNLWTREICTALVFMKDAAFKGENEYRIACPQDRNNALYPDSSLRFKHRGKMLTRHLPFEIYSVGQSPTRKVSKKVMTFPLMLTHVHVGPTSSDVEFERRSAKQFLESNGHNAFGGVHRGRNEQYVVVGSSLIPYRTF